MRITFIKKTLADGSSCRKCAEVEQRLIDAGYWDRIDRVVIADEKDPESEGMQLAKSHQVGIAPFFMVEEDDKPVQIYTVYFRFLKEVLTNFENTSELQSGVS